MNQTDKLPNLDPNPKVAPVLKIDKQNGGLEQTTIDSLNVLILFFIIIFSIVNEPHASRKMPRSNCTMFKFSKKLVMSLFIESRI